MGLGQILRAEARDALVFTSSTLINRVGAFLLLPLFLSRLSPEDYGILAVIAVVGAFQMLLTDRLPLGQLALAGHVDASLVVGDAADSRVRRQAR